MGASPNRPLSRGHQGGVTTGTIPAPTAGINAVDGFLEMQPTDCIYTYNLMPTAYGLVLRKGYKEWAINITGEIRTIIPFSATTAIADKLFAVSRDGIWDVTAESQIAPPLMVDFTTKSAESGRGVFLQYVDASDDQFIYYADQANGLFRYTGATNTWAQAPAFTGVDGPPAPQDIVFIMQHKLRIWFVGRDLINAWYLGINAVEGDAEKFTLTGKFKTGGAVEGLWNWTVDGGSGVDDYLVFLSKSGDVLAYQGDDPSQAETWSNTGTWYIGELPSGRRQATEYGGELYILASSGVIAMGDLLQGVDALSAVPESPTFRISSLIREEMRRKIDNPNWALKYNPADNQLQILIPTENSEPFVQLCQDLSKQSWGFWRDVPIVCSDNWQGKYYFGTADGRVMVMSGAQDNFTITPGGEKNILWSFLTAFQNVEQPSLHKRVEFIRLMGTVAGGSATSTLAVYDFNVTVQPSNPIAPPFVDGGVWDVSQWDAAVWQGSFGGLGPARGATNIGVNFAIAARGEASNEVVLAGIDVAWRTGGYL